MHHRTIQSDSSLRFVAVILFGAFCLHNLEEALTFADHRDVASHLLATLIGFPVTVPSPGAFLLALASITAIAAAVSLWAMRAPPTLAKRRALMVFAAILLLNVFVPHVPAAIMLGGYAPGVVTAVMINFPVAIFAMCRL